MTKIFDLGNNTSEEDMIATIPNSIIRDIQNGSLYPFECGYYEGLVEKKYAGTCPGMVEINVNYEVNLNGANSS